MSQLQHEIVFNHITKRLVIIFLCTKTKYCCCNNLCSGLPQAVLWVILRPTPELLVRESSPTRSWLPHQAGLDRVLNFNMKSHGTQPCTSAPAALTAQKTLPRTNSFEFPGPIIRLISTGQDNESDNTDKLPSRPKRIVTSPRRHSVVLTRAAQLAEQEPPRLSKSKSFCGPLFARLESE